MKNLTVETIVKVCNGTLYGEEGLKESQKEAAGVVLDSRLLQKDYKFKKCRLFEGNTSGPLMIFV